MFLFNWGWCGSQLGLVLSEPLPNRLGLDASDLSQDPGVGFLESSEALSAYNEMYYISICHFGEAVEYLSPHHGRLKHAT